MLTLIHEDDAPTNDEVIGHLRSLRRGYQLIFGAIITLAVGMAALVAKGFQWI